VQRYKPVRFRQVTDGTSFTLLAGDKRMNLSRLGREQADDNEGYTVGWNSDTLRRTGHLPYPDYMGDDPYDDKDDGKDNGDHRFGSSHSQVFMAVFADGAVRPIRYSLELRVFRYLGNINDGYQFDSGAF